MNTITGSQTQSSDLHHHQKDPDLAGRGLAGPEEEDDIRSGRGTGRCNCPPNQCKCPTTSSASSSSNAQCDVCQPTLARSAEGAERGVMEHMTEEETITRPAVVKEVVHHKHIHVIQPVVTREVEVQHVVHHRVVKNQHEGTRAIDEGTCSCPAGTHNFGEHAQWLNSGKTTSGLKRSGSSSSSSSSSSDEEGREGRRERVGRRKDKTTTMGTAVSGGATTGGPTGLVGGTHHQEAPRVTGHHEGAAPTGLTGNQPPTATSSTVSQTSSASSAVPATTGTGLTGMGQQGTTGTGLTGQQQRTGLTGFTPGHHAGGTSTGLTGPQTTTGTTASGMTGGGVQGAETQHKEKRSLGEKIKTLFKGHHE